MANARTSIQISPISGSERSARTVAVIVSTMRAGSTLVKALLAEADDVSNLPEVNFQRFAQRKDAWQRICGLDAHRIVVLKRPAWYWDVAHYPALPDIPCKVIVLFRDVYDTVISLRQMTLGRAGRLIGPAINRLLIEKYWTPINERLWLLAHDSKCNTFIVKYEQLVQQPVLITQRLFEFVGSSHCGGVDSYRRPKNFTWRWGTDDGGDKIKSLQVHPLEPHAYHDRRLLQSILQSSRALRIREQLGYPPLPLA